MFELEEVLGNWEGEGGEIVCPRSHRELAAEHSLQLRFPEAQARTP